MNKQEKNLSDAKSIREALGGYDNATYDEGKIDYYSYELDVIVGFYHYDGFVGYRYYMDSLHFKTIEGLIKMIETLKEVRKGE